MYILDNGKNGPESRRVKAAAGRCAGDGTAKVKSVEILYDVSVSLQHLYVGR